MKNIKISIVVPIFNKMQNLDKCLKSLVSQTLDNIEIILINDGSTDNSAEICLNYLKIYPQKIRYYYNANVGVSETRNKGLELALGTYICFIDADDYINDEFCQMLYDSAIKNDLDIVVSCIYFLKDKVVDKTYTINEYLSAMEFVLDESPLRNSSSNKLFKVSFLKNNNIMYPLRTHFYEDTVFVLQALFMAKSIQGAPDAKYYYCLNDSSTTADYRDNKIIDICTSIDYLYRFLVEKGCFSENFMMSKKVLINGLLLRELPKGVRYFSLKNRTNNHIMKIYLEKVKYFYGYLNFFDKLQFFRGILIIKFFNKFPNLVNLLKQSKKFIYRRGKYE